MKSRFFIFGLILSICTANGQIKRVEKLFNQGSYKACLLQSEKKVRKGKNVKLLYLYIAKSSLALYSENPTNLALLDKSLSAYKRADKEEALFNNLHQRFLQTSDSLHLIKHKKTSLYVRTLAVTFKDTVAYYKVYNQPKENKKEKEIAVAKTEKQNNIKKHIRPSLIQYGTQFVGLPYKWGGEDSAGFDCSGLVQHVMRKFNYPMNHFAKDQSEMGREVPREECQMGDLVFFGKRYANKRCKIDHVAIIYSTENGKLQVLHASNKGVNIQELKENDYYMKKILFFKNVID
jgi:probable lipoprotein NlpC